MPHEPEGPGGNWVFQKALQFTDCMFDAVWIIIAWAPPLFVSGLYNEMRYIILMIFADKVVIFVVLKLMTVLKK